MATVFWDNGAKFKTLHKTTTGFQTAYHSTLDEAITYSGKHASTYICMHRRQRNSPTEWAELYADQRGRG